MKRRPFVCDPLAPQTPPLRIENIIALFDEAHRTGWFS